MHTSILIVDDQENNRLVIEDALRKKNFHIMHASSGEEALRHLENQMVDTILMDQMMPGLSGIQTIEKIKAQEKLQDIPILMITAKDDTATLQQAFYAGASDYIVKPIESVTLNARVNSALKTKFALQQEKALTKELESQKRELSRFTHVVSHDLKSPVASAASLFNFFLFRIQTDYPDLVQNPDYQEILQRIPNSLQRMLDFVDVTLQYATSGKTVGKLVRASMQNIINEVLQDLTDALNQPLIEIEVQNGLPEVCCDPLKIKQVWQNLLGNAIKYRIKDHMTSLFLGWKIRETGYAFFVQDNGTGIPEHARESIFEPFVRLDTSQEGSGVGLATVQQIIHAHQGKVFIDPDYTQGTRIWFTLP